MSDDSIRYWQSLTTTEVADLRERDPVAILPLAAVEQHGPHLPLSTDLEIGMGLLDRAFSHLGSDFPAWVLPPQAIGASTEHSAFPGTLSLGPKQLIRTIWKHGEALTRAGVRRLVLSNSHGGNRAAMDAAGLKLRKEYGLLVVKVSYPRLGRPGDVELPDSEWRHGLHGGAVETAMMLHLRPDLVRTEAITDAPSLGSELEGTMRRLSPEGPASFSWLAQDLNASGVVGDARLADGEMGRRLVDHYGRALADVILDAREFPLDRLT